MTRPAGSRNADFEETRHRLLMGLSRRLAEEDGTSASMRELAAAAGVSAATLRHYFKDRHGLFTALFELGRRLGAEHQLRLASEPLQADVVTSMRWVLASIRTGLEIAAVRHWYTTGLRVALESPRLGPAYVCELLEPLLQAVEVRIERHQARGELIGHQPRLLSLQLVSPLFLAMLHQRSLSGDRQRPLDPDVLIEALVAPLATERPPDRG